MFRFIILTTMDNPNKSNQSDEERASYETRELDRLCEEALNLAHIRLGIEYVSRVTGLDAYEVTPEVMEAVTELTRILVCMNQSIAVYFYDGIPIMAATETPTVTVERVGDEPATVSSSFIILHDEGMKRSILEAFLDEGAAMLGQTRRPL